MHQLFMQRSQTGLIDIINNPRIVLDITWSSFGFCSSIRGIQKHSILHIAFYKQYYRNNFYVAKRT